MSVGTSCNVHGLIIWLIEHECIAVLPMVYYLFLGNREGQVKSEDLGKDIASVQTLLSKHVRIN